MPGKSQTHTDAVLYWDVLITPKTIQQDDYGQFAAGALVVKED